MNKFLATPAGQYTALAALLVFGVWYIKREAAAAVDGAEEIAGKTVEAIDPFNNDNIFSTAVNSTISKIVDVTDDGMQNGTGDFSLGSGIYDVVQWVKGNDQDPTK